MNYIKAKVIKISTKNTIKVIINRIIKNNKYNKTYSIKKKKLIHCNCTFINVNNIIYIKNTKHISKKKTFKLIKIIK